MNKFLLILSLIIILAAGFFALNAYIYNEKQSEQANFEPYRATLSGEYVCLPHIDQTGPQTEECASGMKTENGEYYAVDRALLSQTAPELYAGQKFTASGMITPVERLSTNHWQRYPIKGIFSITDSLEVEGVETDEPQACDADEMMCPDGSSVGRSGPGCEFAACPSPHATSARVTTYMDGTATALNVSVTPHAIISDSRCPTDVTCVWAGTIEILTVLSTKTGHGEHKLTLDKPQVFGDHTVTLVAVTPDKKEAETIPDSSFRFTFEIAKRVE